MATVTKDNAKNLPDPSFSAAYGNLSALQYKFAVNASGVMADSDTAAAVGNGDVVILGIIPSGFQPIDCMVNVRDAFAASTTAKLGFKYVDGVDVTAVPQDDDYFLTASATSAQAIFRKISYTAPITLPKDAYLILTVGGAAHSAAGIADIALLGVINGPL